MDLGIDQTPEQQEAAAIQNQIAMMEAEKQLQLLNRELEQRRDAVLRSIEEQGKLTPELRAAIEAAPTKQELEDLYLPYKPRRRTKGTIAREAGIEPLADRLFADPMLEPLREAQAFVAAYPGGSAALAEAGFADALAVLDGVRDLLSERWAEDAVIVGALREWLWAEGLLRSRLAEGKDGAHPDAAKYRDYFDHAEAIRSVPSHRALAIFRGRTQEWLDAKLVFNDETAAPGKPSLAEGRIASGEAGVTAVAATPRAISLERVQVRAEAAEALRLGLIASGEGSGRARVERRRQLNARQS
jgi:uncharacterized protein